MTTRLPRVSRQRLAVTDQPDGSRLVTLRCRCYTARLVTTQWEPLCEAVEDVRALHCKHAPACLHGLPLAVPR